MAKSKLLAGIFISITALVSSPLNVYAFAGNGGGSSADPYEIADCEQLQAVKDNLSASYELMNSIDCAATTGFTPISGSSSFTGTFDGNNYVIDNLTIKPVGSPDNVSLFGHLDGATIRDFTLDNVHITGGNSVGGIAGLASNNTTISGVKLLNGFIQGATKVGGFVGALGSYDSSDYSPILEFSGSKNMTVQGFSDTARTSHIGGAVGITAGTIKYVSIEGSVNGNIFDNSMSDNVGGIAGETVSNPLNGHSGGLTHSYSRADVAGGTYVGGLVGSRDSDDLSYTYNSGSVTGESYVGGLAGTSNDGYSYSNFSDSVVTGGFPTGALFGYLPASRSFSMHYMGSTFYDSIRSTQPNCVGYDEMLMEPSWGAMTLAGSCSEIVDQAGYFFNNSSTAPFNSWDFVNDWQLQTNNYPLLRGQPSEPTNVSTSPSSSSLKVSWDAPTDAQQAPITGYRLEYSKTGQTAMTVMPITDPTTSSYIITGLDASTDYSLRLRAINQAGGGDLVSFSASTTLGESSVPVSAAQPQSTPLSSQNTQLLEDTDNENTASNELSNQASPTPTDSSSESSNATVAPKDTSTHKKPSSNNAWWWLIILTIAAGIWFWRKHKTKHL